MARRPRILCSFVLAALLLSAVLCVAVPLTSYAASDDCTGSDCSSNGDSSKEDKEVAFKPDEEQKDPEPAQPESEPQTTDKDGKVIKCSDLDEVKDGKLVGKIVPCMIKTIESSTIRFTEKMIKTFRPLLYTFLTLVVVFLGIRIMSAERDIYKHGIILLLKVTFVVAILDQIPTYFVPKTYEIMKESQEILLGTFVKSSKEKGTCQGTKQPDGTVVNWGGDKTLPVWAMSDCILGKLFGFAVTGDGKPGMLLSTSMLGLMTGFLFGGPWGVVVFFGILGVLISFFMLVVRTIFSFITGYMVICLMLIVSPLLLPLTFLKQTQQYGDAVWRIILSSFLLPIIVTAYAMLSFMIYERLLFSDTSMLKSLFDKANISPAQLPPTQLCSNAVINDINDRLSTKDKSTTQKQKLNDLMSLQFLQNLFQPQTSGSSNDACALTKTYGIDPKLFQKDEFKKGKETYNKMFTELMVILILGYLVHLGLRSLDTIIQQLLLASSVISVMGIVNKPEAALNNALSAGRNAAIQSYQQDGYVRDSEMLKQGNIGGAIRRGAEAFFGEINKGSKKQ